jgi:hypothetical protein
MQAERHMMDEVAPVHDADIDRRLLRRRQRLRRSVKLQGNAQRAGEKIHRAERQDAQRKTGFGGSSGRRGNRSVAAADDEGVAGFFLADSRNDANRVPARPYLHRHLVAVAPKDFRQVRRRRLSVLPAQRAGLPVQKECDVHARPSTALRGQTFQCRQTLPRRTRRFRKRLYPARGGRLSGASEIDADELPALPGEGSRDDHIGADDQKPELLRKVRQPAKFKASAPVAQIADAAIHDCCVGQDHLSFLERPAAD